ncbi:MAG: hypothetical protein MUE58_09885 [Chitinophagaceae bacterium]|nr:hypothetical protein [Chitinophagaceae bacterium]
MPVTSGIRCRGTRLRLWNEKRKNWLEELKPRRVFVLILFGLSLLLAGYGCQEKVEDELPSGIEPDHLSMHAWLLDRITIQVLPAPSEADVTTGSLESCERDDLVLFEQSGTFRHQEGTATCTGNGKSVFRSLRNGNWVYSPTDSVLKITMGFNVQQFKMVKLNMNAMHMHQTSIDYLGTETRYHFYFSSK